MAGILLFALNSPGANGPVVRARRDSTGAPTNNGGGMFSRLRSLGSGSGTGDMGWSSGSGPQSSTPTPSAGAGGSAGPSEPSTR